MTESMCIQMSSGNGHNPQNEVKLLHRRARLNMLLDKRFTPDSWNVAQKCDAQCRNGCQQNLQSIGARGYGSHRVKRATIDAKNAPDRKIKDTGDFMELLLNSDTFVDKTLFLDHLFYNDEKVLLFTRPPGWGKSVNLDMLRRFVEVEVSPTGRRLPEKSMVNRKLFAGGTVHSGSEGVKQLNKLKIGKILGAMNIQGTFPVIYLSLKDVNGSSYKEFEDSLREKVKGFLDSHRYILRSTKINSLDKADLQTHLYGNLTVGYLQLGLRYMCRILSQHFKKKTFVIFDDYDEPLIVGKRNLPADDYRGVEALMRGFYTVILRYNPYIIKGVMAGRANYLETNLLNNMPFFTDYNADVEDFSEYFGFTQAEINKLLANGSMEAEAMQMKNYCDNYTIKNTILYSPRSVRQRLKKMNL